MTPDPFSSPLISQILTWVFSIPIVFSIFAGAIWFLFNKDSGIPRIILIWLAICLIFLSPLRYIILQLFLATAYPWQSFSALFSSIPLGFYIPILFGILCGVGLIAPLLIAGLIAGTNEPHSKGRLLLSGILAPIIFILFSYAYYFILPYAAYSTHWLNTTNVMRSTNGPPYYVYRYLVEPITPLQYSGITRDIGLENMTAKERFRAHVAGVYCGEKQHWYYISKSYPDYFEKLMQKNTNN